MSARKVSAQQGLLKRCIVVPVALALLATGCGFHLPNQAKLDDTMPEVVVTGDYHDQFYKLVVRRLRPNVLDEVVSVNSRAQSLEYALVVSVAPTLAIPNHRPIMMRNSVTRSVLNKPGQALASDTEKAIVIQETKEDLADQLVMRLSYLGRSSDPDASVPQPAELILAQGESSAQDTAAVTQATTQTQGMTLLEALQQQDQYESAQGTQLTLDQLNNGQRILNNKSYELPKVKPEPLHQAPEHLY